MIKKLATFVALGVGTWVATAGNADAGIIYRVAPVRRVAARTALPPYPVARRVVPGPVVGPVYGGPVLYGPAMYAPVYGPVIGVPGVSVSVGW